MKTTIKITTLEQAFLNAICEDRYRYCEHYNEYFYYENGQEIQGVWYSDRAIESGYVEVQYCDECGEYSFDLYTDGVCPHCDNDMREKEECEACGEESHAVFNDEKCPECGHDKNEEEEDEDEECA